MPSDNLDELTQTYGTFGKSKAQREPKPAATQAAQPAAKRPMNSAEQARYNFEHASDWLNRANEKKASPKLIIKPATKKPATAKARPAKIAAAAPLGAPDDGSV